MLTTGQESAVTQVLVDLQTQLGAAWTEVATSSRFFNPTIRAAVLANLETDRARLERLGGELLDQARAGTLPFQNWSNIATLTHEDIAYQRGLTSTWSLTGVLASAAAETVHDVKAGAEDVVKSVGGGAAVRFIVGLLNVLGLAWKLK